jgi:adenylate cyclase
VSGLARERSNIRPEYGLEVVTIGGVGRSRAGRQSQSRPCGAGGRDGRLCLPAAATHLPVIERLTGARSPVPVTASIAVLPFSNQSEGKDDYFSDGLTEDLISALGHFSSISVISWNAVAPYRNQMIRPERLAQDLGVQYVVDGSVRRADNRLRVTTRLNDAEHGTLLWSEHYDRAVDDVFAVQDDISRQIVSALALQVTNLEQDRAAKKPTDSLNAYDYYLRARQEFRQFTRRGNLRAQEFLGKAIDLDHEYADAYAALAWTHTKAAEMGWTE